MAYAALVSLMHILEQILHPARNFISLNKEQIGYLQRRVGILQDFLENYAQTRIKEIKELEIRIKDAAYAAEDMIESHIVDQIHEGYKSNGDKSFIVSPLDLQKTIEEMDSVEKELVQIKEIKGLKEEQTTNISGNNTLSRPPPSGKNRMVGFDKHLIQIMDVVTGHQSNRQVFSIVGMGGIVNGMEFTSGISLLWNLQTLIVSDVLVDNPLVLPSEIWRMPQLRHLEIKNVVLPDPPCDQIDRKVSVILENLQTLLTVKNFKCSEEILKRIPNVKKLKVSYYELPDFLVLKTMRGSSYCLANLQHLHKLESLTCSLPYSGFMIYLKDLAFPLSLKKLTLSCLCTLPWKYMTIVGSLPNLEVLKLRNSFDGIEWNTIEGQFRRLKFLLIERNEMIYWRTDKSHFPRLEQLVLRHMFLDEIPSCIGEIPTLRLIRLDYCGDSTVVSANKILQEQHDMGNEGLQVQVLVMQ